MKGQAKLEEITKEITKKKKESENDGKEEKLSQKKKKDNSLERKCVSF